MKTETVMIRMPRDLRLRLEFEADKQGVSIDELASYLLAIQLTQLETLSSLEIRLTQKTIPDLKAKIRAILDRVPDRDVPVWDERNA